MHHWANKSIPLTELANLVTDYQITLSATLRSSFGWTELPNAGKANTHKQEDESY
jgi:hypothetical protein